MDDCHYGSIWNMPNLMRLDKFQVQRTTNNHRHDINYKYHLFTVGTIITVVTIIQFLQQIKM